MPLWLSVVIAVGSVMGPIASAWILHFYKSHSEERDRKQAALAETVRAGFGRNDTAIKEQAKITSELRDKVGAQNGRIGKLEVSRDDHGDDIRRVEQRQWDDSGGFRSTAPTYRGPERRKAPRLPTAAGPTAGTR